jgi:hypothetical protein
MSYWKSKVQEHISALRNLSTSLDTNTSIIYAFTSTISTIADSKGNLESGRADSEVIAEVIEVLCGAVRDEDIQSTDVISHALYRLGKPAVQPVIDILRDIRQSVRKRAAKILSQITGKRFLWGNQNPIKWQNWCDRKGIVEN